MQVGGERELTIPPAMAYGNKQTDKIPPGSTLVFCKPFYLTNSCDVLKSNIQLASSSRSSRGNCRLAVMVDLSRACYSCLMFSIYCELQTKFMGYQKYHLVYPSVNFELHVNLDFPFGSMDP